MTARIALAALALFALSACQEADIKSVPGAVTMTEEALGHYCQMNLAEHEGPKAQIHVAGSEHPLWFSQVRDAVAFTRLPEETADVAAIYVSDMGRAPSWTEPGNDNWVDANAAWFVIASRMAGGMGAPEAVPFADRQAAESFVSDYGGRVVRLADIPDDYVLAPVDVAGENSPSGGHDVPGHDNLEQGGGGTQ